MQAARFRQRPQFSSRRTALPVRRRNVRLDCHSSVVWRQLERSKAWVAHPRAARVKGIIHFLGGAFAGAAPQLLYNGFVELLADAGYTIIATPYAVTFRHDQCAKQVRQTFLDSISELRATGRSYLVPQRAPQFGVGHSNGALLHLLIGSLEPGATQGNVIISYNNLQVSDAIPIPGLLGTLQPTVQAARSVNSSNTSTFEEESANDSANTTINSSSSSGSGGTGALTPGRRSPGKSGPAAPASQQVLAAAAASLLLPEQEQQLLVGASPALEQLASIVNEVGDGLTDFRPSPEESRAIVAAGYCCPATLLVQFENDSIDETAEMQQILTQRLSNIASSNGSSGSSSGSSETNSFPSAEFGGDSKAPAGSGAVADASQPSAAAETATAAATAAAAVATSEQFGTDAWSSIDEDVDISRVLQQLEQLQLQQQQQQQQQLQRLVLAGSHITPCGGQARRQPGLLPTPVDVLLNSASQAGSQAELKNLASQVLSWLETCRNQSVATAGGWAQQQQQGSVRSAGPGVGSPASQAAAGAATAGAAAGLQQ